MLDIGVDLKVLYLKVREFVLSSGACVSEYQIIKHLDEQAVFSKLEASSVSLRLFQKHFLTMHALYRLQSTDEGYVWFISPLSIECSEKPKPKDVEVDSKDVGGFDGVAEYYLDLDHYFQATPDSVDELLRGFWSRFKSWHTSEDSFALLGVKPGSPWEDVVQAYRKKAQQLHPDKGGSAEAFATLKNEFERLKLVYGENLPPGT